MGKRDQKSKRVIRAAGKAVKRQGALLAVSVLLLMVLGVYATIAWYTRLTNVTGLTFDAADFDFRAQYVTDSFLIDVNDYMNVENQKAAPGTQGIIPILVSAENSGTDVDYSININKEGMAPELEERIRFYYYSEDADGSIREHTLGNGADDIRGTLPAGTSERTEYLYWEWMYTADITPVLEAPDGSGGWTAYETIDEMSDEEIYYALDRWQEALAASDGSGEEAKQRYESLKENGHLANVDPGNPNDACMEIVKDWRIVFPSEKGSKIRTYLKIMVLDPWDEVDTKVGSGFWDEEMTARNGIVFKKYTKTTGTNTVTYQAYQMAMQVQLQVSGVQAKPLERADDPGTATGTTVFKPINKA